jgi:hypothetical protein
MDLSRSLSVHIRLSISLSGSLSLFLSTYISRCNSLGFLLHLRYLPLHDSFALVFGEAASEFVRVTVGGTRHDIRIMQDALLKRSSLAERTGNTDCPAESDWQQDGGKRAREGDRK